MVNEQSHVLNLKAHPDSRLVLCDDPMTLPTLVPASPGRTEFPPLCTEFPPCRIGAFDGIAARATVLDAELISGVWRVTKAAADRRAV